MGTAPSIARREPLYGTLVRLSDKNWAWACATCPRTGMDHRDQEAARLELREHNRTGHA